MLFSLICIMLVLQPMVVPHAPLHHANISASSTQVVSEVLSKMLMVGITDPGMLWIFFFFFLRYLGCFFAAFPQSSSQLCIIVLILIALK